MSRTQDLTGRKFGKLTATARAANIGTAAAWICKCECGNEVVVRSGSLRRGDTKSCGCLSKEKPSHFTHGGTGSKLYGTYRNMLERCYNPKNKRFKNYGGRGIKVCNKWKASFETFRNWAVANGYADSLTLDRINADENYCPENCRWATMEQQQNNRTNNHKITYNGETKTISEWSKERGIKYSTLERRINAFKWDIKRALNF